MTKQARLLLAFLTVAVAAVFADDDPPSRVARLNYIDGSISFRPGNVEEWTSAAVNYPLTTGDHLWADAFSRTEIHVGSTAIRMSSHTAVAILNLDDRMVQLSLTEGSLNVRVRDLAEDEGYEIDTPNVAVTLLRPGDYRIDVDSERNTTVVTVRSGDTAVTGGGIAFPVHSRQSARIVGVEQVQEEVMAAPPPDDFDAWCESRERREAEAQTSARYVPREMVGYEDLDSNGVWSESQQYGWIWRPHSVPVGWAPYRYGHWAWVAPWGWTWIDDAPWGFAPFHYGRWAYAGGAWVWVPGRMVVGARPVYAPALVAFIGGPRFGVSVGVGGGVAAWFPLGPGEVYRPAYHSTDSYVRRVNVTHVTNINVTNVRYANQNINGAVTAVPQETFASRRAVSQAALRVDPRELSQAQVVNTAEVAPRRESIVARNGAPPASPPDRYARRTVVVRTQPPAPPVAFAAQQEALRNNHGRPLEPSQMERMRGNAPVERPAFRTVTAPPANAAPRPRYDTQPNPVQPNVTQPEPRREPRNERPAFSTRPQPAPPNNAPGPIPQVRETPRERPSNQVPPQIQPPVRETPRRIEERPAVIPPRPQIEPQQPRPEPRRTEPREQPRVERQPRTEPRQERPAAESQPKKDDAPRETPRERPGRGGERKQDEKK